MARDVNSVPLSQTRTCGSQHVVHEVHRAALTGCSRHLGWHHTLHATAPSLRPSRQLQPLLGVEPLNPLVVHDAELAADHHRHTGRTDGALAGDHLLQATVLVLKLLWPLHFRCPHAAVSTSSDTASGC